MNIQMPQTSSKVNSQIQSLTQNLLSQIESETKEIPDVVDFYHEYLIDTITGSPLMPESKQKRLPLFWQDILYHVAHEPRWYLIQLPREHYKTSLITCGIPIYRICENENFTGGLIMSNQGNANSQLERIKTILETNKQLINDFGPFKPESKKGIIWRNNEFRIKRTDINQTMPTLFASGAGSGITGKHCDQLILDDIEDDRSVLTEDRRDRTIAWFRATVMPILKGTAINKYPGQMIVVGTRKHASDIYSRMLSGELKGQDLVEERLAGSEAEGESLLEQTARNLNNMEIINA